MTEVKKQLDVTLKDFMKYKYTEYLGSVLKDLGMILSVLLFAGMFYLYKNFDMSFTMLFISAVPAATYLYILCYYIPKTAKEEYNISSYNKIKIDLTVEKDAITVNREGRPESKIALDQLLSAWATKKYYYFFITKQNSLILPKRQLSQEENAFIKEVFKSLPAKKRKNPYKVKFKSFVSSALATIFIVFCITMVIISFTIKK